MNLKKYKVILFDLDGTLTEPKIGITKSVQYALQKMGINEPNLDKLEPFIGPPLQDAFKEMYGFNEELSKQAVTYYRERFSKIGIFENEVFENIPQLLQLLKKSGYILSLATSKPTVFAERILEHFQLKSYFSLIEGSNLDGTHAIKREIIASVMEHFDEFHPEDFLMVGDRKYDIIGANENGIDSIAVLYGYGSYDELKSENPTYIAETVNEIEEYLLKLQK